MIRGVAIQGSEAVLRIISPDDALSFISFLHALDVKNVEKKGTVIRLEQRFWDYLIKDRGLDERTERCYASYLKRLERREVSYDLYLA